MGQDSPNIEPRQQRFESMLEQILDICGVKKEHGIHFLKELVYPIEDHVLQCGMLFLTKDLDDGHIIANMQNIKTEQDSEFIHFVTRGILLMKNNRSREVIEKELRKEINMIFSAATNTDTRPIKFKPGN